VTGSKKGKVFPCEPIVSLLDNILAELLWSVESSWYRYTDIATLMNCFPNCGREL